MRIAGGKFDSPGRPFILFVNLRKGKKGKMASNRSTGPQILILGDDTVRNGLNTVSLFKITNFELDSFIECVGKINVLKFKIIRFGSRSCWARLHFTFIVVS